MPILAIVFLDSDCLLESVEEWGPFLIQASANGLNILGDDGNSVIRDGEMELSVTEEEFTTISL